ncbi:MAG TPA: ABC transporter permease [Ilumatobacteraceae bacterium]|nr:ABC transporter permease [Ilumatobacteraceae bacterium]
MADIDHPVRRAASDQLRPMAIRRSVPQHVRELFGFRELLWSLTRKELTVRYKHSALGFLWSMIQQLFLLVVYTAVFAILGAGFPRFAIWVLCGLLVWTFAATAMLTGTTSITANGPLVGKVKFPRAVLPLASVGSALMHFMLQSIAFAVVLLVTQHQVDWTYMWLVPIALLVAVLVVSGLVLLLAPLNVLARDTMHLLELLVLGWFWMTPILYQYERAVPFLERHGLPGEIMLINPFTSVIITFQRAIYGKSEVEGIVLLPDEGPLWYLAILLITGAVATVILAIALKVFDRADANLAEAL